MAAIERPTADPVLRGLLWLTAVLRLASVAGRRAYVYFDSGDYETLDFTGGARRPWATPLLYAILGDDRSRVLAQALIGAVAWTFLAVQVAAMLEHRWAKRGAAAAVLALSLTTSVTNWDTTILSESLAVSLTALLFGCLLRFARSPSAASAGVAVAAFVPWLFTRQNHLVLGFLLLAAAVGVLAVRALRRSGELRPLAVVAGGLLAVLLLGVATFGRNTEILHFNLAMVIGNRVLPSAADTQWFVDHGMPRPDGVATGETAGPEELLDDPAFARWVDDDGTATYARYLLAFPWGAVTTPLEDFVGDRPAYADPPSVDETMLSTAEAYGSTRQVVPGVVEDFLFAPGDTGLLLLAIAATGFVTFRRWGTSGADPRWTVPLLAIALQWPALTVVWHASTAELGRLSLTSAIALRLGLLTQIALLADAWLQDRPLTAAAAVDDDPATDR